MDERITNNHVRVVKWVAFWIVVLVCVLTGACRLNCSSMSYVRSDELCSECRRRVKCGDRSATWNVSGGVVELREKAEGQ